MQSTNFQGPAEHQAQDSKTKFQGIFINLDGPVQSSSSRTSTQRQDQLSQNDTCFHVYHVDIDRVGVKKNADGLPTKPIS